MFVSKLTREYLQNLITLALLLRISEHRDKAPHTFKIRKKIAILHWTEARTGSIQTVVRNNVQVLTYKEMSQTKEHGHLIKFLVQPFKKVAKEVLKVLNRKQLRMITD